MTLFERIPRPGIVPGSGYLFFIGLFVASCTTLEQSEVDQWMRYQGSFTCELISHEKQNSDRTLAAEDVSRVRCAKDQWIVAGDQVYYVRRLFQDPECGIPLGSIEFRSPVQSEGATHTFKNPRCKLYRRSPAWVSEGNGKCMLNQVPLNRPQSIKPLSRCKEYLPEFCTRTGVQSIVPIESAKTDLRQPYEQVAFANQKNCFRYQNP